VFLRGLHSYAIRVLPRRPGLDPHHASVEADSPRSGSVRQLGRKGQHVLDGLVWRQLYVAREVRADGTDVVGLA